MSKSRTPVIRRATDKDAERIANVLFESFVEYQDLYTPRAFEATVLSRAGVLERMTEGPVWATLHEDIIVATASIVERTNGVYIRGMGVLPRARGGRLGWYLLEHIETFAIERGASRMYLSTTPFLARAIRLYENYGFDPAADGPFDLYGTPLFTMVKSVHKAAT